jgi:glycosyltransferase involved in cell wall biosynthesis
MTRVLHVTTMVATRHGGPAKSLSRLLALNQLDSSVERMVVAVATPSDFRNMLSDSIYGPSVVAGRVHHVPLEFSNRWFFGTRSYQRIRELSVGCDVIHAHMFWDHPVWCAARAAEVLKLPLVVTPHGTFNERWRYSSIHKRLYLQTLARAVFRTAQVMHCLNEREAYAMREVGYTGRTFVIPNPLAQEVITPSPRAARNRSIYRLMYVGRLSSEKNLPVLIEAAGTVGATAHEKWELCIVGGGSSSYALKLSQQIAVLNHRRAGMRIVLAGEISSRQVSEALQSADAFILPSKSEGVSNALLEAMVAELPCVVSERALPGLGLDAVLIQSGSSCDSLRRSISTLMEMSDVERIERGKRAGRQVRAICDPGEIAKAWKLLYGAI